MTDYVDHAGDILSVGYAADEDPSPNRLAFETITRDGAVPVELDRAQVVQLSRELHAWLGEETPAQRVAGGALGLVWVLLILAGSVRPGHLLLMSTSDFGPIRFETYQRPMTQIYGRFTIWYAEKNGAPVLRGERSWTKINGFMIRTRKGRSYSIQFRRVHRF